MQRILNGWVRRAVAPLTVLAILGAVPSRADVTVDKYVTRGFSMAGNYQNADGWTASMEASEAVSGPGRPGPYVLCNVIGACWDGTGVVYGVGGPGWDGETLAVSLRSSNQGLTLPASASATLSGSVRIYTWDPYSITIIPATLYAECALDPPADVQVDRQRHTYTTTWPDGSKWIERSDTTGRSGTTQGVISLIAVTADGTVYTFAVNAPAAFSRMSQIANGTMTVTKVRR